MTELEEMADSFEPVRAEYEKNPDAPVAWLATATLRAMDFPPERHPFAYQCAHQTVQKIAQVIRDGISPEQYLAAERAEEEPDHETMPMMDAEAMRARADALARHAEGLEAWRHEKFGSVSRHQDTGNA